MPTSPSIHRLKDFVTESAAFIARLVLSAAESRETVVIALSGGSTPEPVYRELSGRDLPWSKLVFTFGDERSVPPDNASSNYRMARTFLLDHATDRGSRVIRIAGELDPLDAAERCEQSLKDLAEEREESVLRHDILLLGLGDDGHTASLFPHTQALAERSRWVVANHVLKLNTWRITFTYPLINAASNVLFLVKDPRKESIIQEILAGGSPHPAEGVKPDKGSVTWLLGHPA